MALFVWYNEIGGTHIKGGDFMRQFIGVASCENETEAANVTNAATFIPGVKIHQEGTKVEVIFEPDDRCSSFEEERTMKRILDVIETVKEHGFSTIS